MNIVVFNPRYFVRSAHEAAVNPLGPVPPRTVLEALEQRMDKYKETCDQAKANGDERKARMYDRIVKVTDHMTPSINKHSL